MVKTEVKSNDVLLVQTSQSALASQLVALSTSLDLKSGEKVLALESPSSSFIINGVLLPLYLGCDLFILPAQVTKQSPEVWPRIVEKHNIQERLFITKFLDYLYSIIWSFWLIAYFGLILSSKAYEQTLIKAKSVKW